MALSSISTSNTASAFAGARDAGARSSSASASGERATDGRQLSKEEAAEVRKLKQRDQEVRRHEQAHLAAAGGLATSSASFTYQRGPDGVNYAVGGEVGIDVSPGRTPEETVQRARTIRAAALAPADPSGQDRAVAAQAAQMEQQAALEQAQQRREEASATPAANPGSPLAAYGGKAADATGSLVNVFA